MADPATANDADRRQTLIAIQDQVAHCQRCVVAGHIAMANPVGGARGRITDRVMLIGQAPGRLSVERGMPFGGPGGRILEQWLTQAGFPPGTLRSGVYLTALTRCFPGKMPSGKGDRAPSPAEIALCQPYLAAELRLVDPPLVLLVGSLAIRALCGPGPLEEWVGTLHVHAGRRWLPLPHPSGVSTWLNAPAHRALLDQGLATLSDWRAACWSPHLPPSVDGREPLPLLRVASHDAQEF